MATASPENIDDSIGHLKFRTMLNLGIHTAAPTLPPEQILEASVNMCSQFAHSLLILVESYWTSRRTHLSNLKAIEVVSRVYGIHSAYIYRRASLLQGSSKKEP
ncbi:hypothetical protein evm_004762 [Chilo suppressalis]|nr:hypothetical protein evm_004762 [Chilo suppressalis]